MKMIPILLLLFWTLVVEAKNCKKGIPCGNSCIAAWKTCHIDSTPYSSAQGGRQQRSLLGSQPEPASSELREVSEDGDVQVEKIKTGKFRFRSTASNYFLCESGEGAILKCITHFCVHMVNLDKGAKIDFLDGFKIVEFQTSLGSHSCDVKTCVEISKN